MRVAVSNIAWAPGEDMAVAARLRAAGVTGVQVAPTVVWPDLSAVRPAEAIAYGHRWARAGLPVMAAQSLLYGRPDLRLFDADSRADFTAHLAAAIDVCAAMGATVVVFGSPRNRRRDGLAPDTAHRIAVQVFGALADRAESLGVCLCLAANPARYGADFMTTAAEAADVVRAVNMPGLRLQLDTACMALADDDAVKCAADFAADLRHAQLSAMDLGPLGDPEPEHAAFADALHVSGYQHWVSVEMRRTDDPIAAVERAARYAVSVFS
jgi:D-psicose/D-tagatose/L-ribulose 3-epimerase